MKMLRIQWIICFVLLPVELLAITVACPNDTCAVINSSDTSIAEQVIDKLKAKRQNDSFTFYIKPGRYNSTNGNQTNFYYFSKITLQKDPGLSDEAVIIQCPYFTLPDAGNHNGIGFINSTNISIIGLTFTKCGRKTFGSYFEYISNLYVFNSVFHYNLNNGLGIRFGTNVSIVNCIFEGNVGFQKDSPEFLIQDKSNVYGGSSLGINLRDTNNTNITVDSCTFKNNVALKSVLRCINDSRPYNYIPYGTGGGIYINLNSVTNVRITIANCHFYNNIALHQGGGIVAFMINSRNTMVEVIDCHFIENKVIRHTNLSNYSEEIMINNNFSMQTNDFIHEALLNISSQRKKETGGVGGAIIVNFFGYRYSKSEHNKIIIKNSTFNNNSALSAAGVGIFMWDALYVLQSGVNSNRVWIYNCSFNDNHATMGGSAIGFFSRVGINTTSLSSVIEECHFKDNIIEDKLDSVLFRFGTNGVISTIRLPLTFRGVNQFTSNIGGCINIIDTKVDINGTVLFTNNSGAYLGGAMKIVGVSFVHLFPRATMIFIENSAQKYGGAIGVDNVRVEEDLQSILNYNCFLQYNVGGEDELYPSNWKVEMLFTNNTALQGHTMYAEDISRCTSTPNVSTKSAGSIYKQSFFSFTDIFKYSQTRDFASASSNMKVNDNKTLVVFPGEKFTLSLEVLDQNNKKTEGIYRYYSGRFSPQADVIKIDLTTGNGESSFGFVNGSVSQRAVIVIRNNSEKDFSFNPSNMVVTEKDFFLNLTDTSTGITIKEIKVKVKLRPCHFLYNYNSTTGKCQFNRNHSRHILRGDKNSTYFYMQSEWYGELENNLLRTARIPPFYQLCHHEGLAGCLVKYNDSDQQCSQGRSGFLCGKCPHGSENEVQGLAFNLLECVSCETGDRILFIFICIVIVVLSILIMYYNVGLPNSLRGFLFYSQMMGYVYVGGARSGALDWDFFLSRVFGFSFYFPICLARMEALQVVLFGFLPPALILISVISYTTLARRITPLSNKKTLDGIWFLILIVYVYTFDTCFNLLRCTASYVHSDDFSKTEFHSLVYFYDGSVTCYEDEHIIYAVISILILLTFVIPFPFVVIATSYSYFKRAGPFTDVINTGIKPKFKWWSGYDLLRRLIFVTMFFVFDQISSGDYTQLAMTLCAIFILLITSKIHPYSKWIVNFIECTILLNLVFIAAYFVNTDQSVTGSDFATFLFVLPYIYMLIYVVTKCIRKMDILKRFRKRRINVFAISTQSLLLLKENDATGENEDSPYIQYREELLEYVESL